MTIKCFVILKTIFAHKKSAAIAGKHTLPGVHSWRPRRPGHGGHNYGGGGEVAAIGTGKKVVASIVCIATAMPLAWGVGRGIGEWGSSGASSGEVASYGAPGAILPYYAPGSIGDQGAPLVPLIDLPVVPGPVFTKPRDGLPTGQPDLLFNPIVDSIPPSMLIPVGDTSPQNVPEPSSILIMLSGIIGLLFLRRMV